MGFLKNNKGFTLGELMVVVAIVGILAAIAITNFSAYKGKSRTAEAKTLLGSLHTSQYAYKLEKDSYHGCLNLIGFEGAAANGPEGNTRYGIYMDHTLPAASFDVDPALGVAGDPDCDVSGGSPAGDTFTEATNLPFPASVFETSPTLNGGTGLTGASFTDTTFTGYAIGKVTDGPPAVNDFDTWSIDEEKELQNVFTAI